MSEKSINFRLNSEAAKLYEEYREKYTLEEISDSQIIRAGLANMMAMPDAVSSEDVDELNKNQEQIVGEIKKIIQKNPDPQLYELWKKLMKNTDKLQNCFEKSAEKYSNVVGDGKAGRHKNPKRKRGDRKELGYGK